MRSSSASLNSRCASLATFSTSVREINREPLFVQTTTSHAPLHARFHLGSRSCPRLKPRGRTFGPEGRHTIEARPFTSLAIESIPLGVMSEFRLLYARPD